MKENQPLDIMPEIEYTLGRIDKPFTGAQLVQAVQEMCELKDFKNNVPQIYWASRSKSTTTPAEEINTKVGIRIIDNRVGSSYDENLEILVGDSRARGIDKTATYTGADIYVTHLPRENITFPSVSEQLSYGHNSDSGLRGMAIAIEGQLCSIFYREDHPEGE